jgi:hypothetical protein
MTRDCLLKWAHIVHATWTNVGPVTCTDPLPASRIFPQNQLSCPCDRSHPLPFSTCTTPTNNSCAVASTSTSRSVPIYWIYPWVVVALRHHSWKTRALRRDLSRFWLVFRGEGARSPPVEPAS